MYLQRSRASQEWCTAPISSWGRILTTIAGAELNVWARLITGAKRLLSDSDSGHVVALQLVLLKV